MGSEESKFDAFGMNRLVRVEALTVSCMAAITSGPDMANLSRALVPVHGLYGRAQSFAFHFLFRVEDELSWTIRRVERLCLERGSKHVML